MRPALASYFLIVLVAAGVTYATVPFFLKQSLKRGVTSNSDRPGLAKPEKTPLLGGLAMFCGFAVTFVVAALSGLFEPVFTQEGFFLFNLGEPLGILAAAIVATTVGAIDDIKDISAPAKTVGITAVGVTLVLSGINIIWFRIPFLDVFVVDFNFTFLLTVIWVLGMSNAINFIDGLDGLAAGIVGIAGFTFMLYGFRLGQVDLIEASNIGPLIAAIVVGICAGFLPWNFYPAKIFMGDSGSLLLGCLMAASTVAVGGRTPDPFSGQTFFFYAPLVIPLVILGVPIVDTAFAIIRRGLKGQGFATADKDHLHHRLMRLGHGHRRSVLILWAWTALLSVGVLYPTYNEGQGDAIAPIGVAVLGGALYIGLLVFTLRPGPEEVVNDSGLRDTAKKPSIVLPSEPGEQLQIELSDDRAEPKQKSK